MCHLLPPNLNQLGAFAGDVGFAARNLYQSLRIALACFAVSHCAAGPELATSKTVLAFAAAPTCAVPLQRLAQYGLQDHRFRASTCGRYLGIYLGPGGAERSRNGPCANLCT
eukprot:8187293-Pyramimonas_sp.AAC.1